MPRQRTALRRTAKTVQAEQMDFRRFLTSELLVVRQGTVE